MSEPVTPQPEETPNPSLMRRMAKFLRLSREEKVQATAEALPETLMPNKALQRKKADRKAMDEQTRDE